MKNGRIKSFLADGFLHYGRVLFLILLLSTLGAAQPQKTRVMRGSAAKGSAPADLKVAADLEQRCAAYLAGKDHHDIAAAVASEDQTGAFDAERFQTNLASYLASGEFE